MSEKFIVLSDAINIDSNKPQIKTTGSWRVERPVWREENCTNCMLCWLYCPDACIKLNEQGKMAGVDYDYCKGCGICIEMCPTKPKSLIMVLETSVAF